RVMSDKGHLLLVLHDPPAAGEAKRVGRLFWRDAEGSWRSRPLGDGAGALKRHVAEFAERMEALEKQCLSAEGAEDYYRILRAIFGAIFAMMHARDDHGLHDVDAPALFWIAMAAGLVGGLILGRLIARKPGPVEASGRKGEGR